MDQNDQQAITTLFRKLQAVEQQGTPRDPEAEDFIRKQVETQPGAPYYMAQTIVVQEQALEAAQAKIEELEARGQSEGGGLLGSLFGGGSSRGSVPSVGRRPAQLPAGQPSLGHPAHNPAYARGGSGGFLAGATQTAMGVAGGMLLGSAIAGMMTGDAAAEPSAADAAAGEGSADAGSDTGGDFGGDMGGDFGDLGGF